MSAELAAWITPALLVAATALLLRSISRVEDRLSARIDEVNKSLGARIDETNKRIDGIEGRLRAVEHGQAKLEGLLEGLREAIAGRRPAA